MIKLDINDFIDEVKEEIKSYEELGDAKALEWEENFRKWLDDDTIIKKNIKGAGNNIKYALKDESEIFDIVDEYLEATELKKEDEYWIKFQ